jgi:hypothetical protein
MRAVADRGSHFVYYLLPAPSRGADSSASRGECANIEAGGLIARGHSVDRQTVVVLTEALGSKSWVHGTRERGTRHSVAREQRKLSRSGLAATLARRQLGRAPDRMVAGQGKYGPCEVTSALLVSYHTAIIILDRQWGCLQFVDCDLREETIHQKHVNILHTHRFSTSPCRGLRVRPALVVGRPLPTRRRLPGI